MRSARACRHRSHRIFRIKRELLQWHQFIRRPEARPHVIFLSDYDMLLTERLVQGVDIWINTPRRPWEASGTSGMKVLVNGGLNLSELDGWWAEAYTPEVGWALGDGQEHGDDPAWDAAEAAALYDLLEREVIPAFYTRDAQGIPAAWVARIRESMARLTPHFSANRAVRAYTVDYYLPAAAAYRARAAEHGTVGRQLVQWQHMLAQHWAALRFGHVRVETQGDQYVFEVHVSLHAIDPQMVRMYDRIAREYVVGTQRFQGMAGRIGVPADCRVLHLNYSYALSRNPVLITETAHRLVGGDYAGLHRMLSTVGRDLDEKYAAADSELSRLCSEYNVRKSFTIGDNGGGGGSILGF